MRSLRSEKNIRHYKNAPYLGIWDFYVLLLIIFLSTIALKYYLAPEGRYTNEWMSDPRFIIGTLIFIAGFYINLQSDYIIRHLRKPGDTKHYIPKGGMFKYVCSANYFGELTEWIGFAILTWSFPGVVFALWTFANLGPRAKSLDERYAQEFGNEYTDLKRKYILPHIW